MLLLLAVACTSPAQDDSAADTAGPDPIVTVTFNTGTSEGMPHDAPPDDGYTGDDATLSDTWYGDGLAWKPAVEATTAFLARVQPDIIGFQEIFYSPLCAGIPPEAHGDFVCEDWVDGQPTVAQVILGEGYQVMCHPGHDDKCAAVLTDFGRFSGCDDDFCLEGMQGSSVDGCGSGARVGRALIERADGPDITLVNVHGSSGLSDEDEACRTAQVEQVFVDLGDGEPGANGTLNIVLGDFNTDPGRWVGIDPSAARWADFVGAEMPFHFVSDVGEQATPTYNHLANIDHVISDTLDGDCWAAGVSDQEPAVLDATYFDHVPVVCDLQ